MVLSLNSQVNSQVLPEPRALSEEQLVNYLTKQTDPMAGPERGRWEVAAEGDGWRLSSSLSFPVNLHFQLGHAVDWFGLEDTEPQSEALWRLGLGFLPSLLLASEDMELVNEQFESLWDFTQTPQWEERRAWMTSLDHALATRVRAICTVSCLYFERGWELPESARHLLQYDLDLINADPEQFIKVSNHGAMVAIALLHADQIGRAHV